MISSYPITNQSFEEFTRILSMADDGNVIVLTYHFISDIGPLETSTPIDNFKKQMKYLKDNNFEVVLLSDLISGRIDISPPKVTFINPLNGSTVSGSLKIGVSAME